MNAKKTDAEMLGIYKGLWQIEDAFRVTKSDLETRPVFLSRQDRIEAHFLVCFIALYIAKPLAKRLDNKHPIAKIATSLNSMSYTFLEDNLFVGDYCDDVSADVKEKLGIDLDRKYLTRGGIRTILENTKKSAGFLSRIIQNNALFTWDYD